MYRLSWKILACPGGFLKKRIGSPGRSIGYKTNQKILDKRECEEFEMTLQHKSELRVYKELKWKSGFEEYLECVREHLLDCFLSFVQVG